MTTYRPPMNFGTHDCTEECEHQGGDTWTTSSGDRVYFKGRSVGFASLELAAVLWQQLQAGAER